MAELSIIIPARNEMFLARTVQDILSNIEGDTEIIVALDGVPADPPIPQDPRVKVIEFPESIGQRRATNEAVKLSTAKYIMKCDAHCAFDKGFDVKMMAEMHDDWTLVPTMRNLHVFDWVCPDGHRRYQGPSGVCTECGKETTRDIVWIAKNNPQSNAYRFDTDMHFQYWPELADKEQGQVTETMSLQGSCFMLTREKYWELDICSEYFSSWGQQGVEVACKTWLSGGKVMVNRNTWYAHMFRTQGGDFSFPYENPGRAVVENRKKSKELFAKDNWDKAIYPFQWLIDKFNPPGWKPEVTKGIVFYTTNQLNLGIAHRVQKQLRNIGKDKGIQIVSSSLKSMTFGDKNVVAHKGHFEFDENLKEHWVESAKPGYLTMARQILVGLEASEADVVFLCEHDVLYHPTHFDFTPLKKDIYYYNTNFWWYRKEDGHCLYFTHRSLSGLCGYRETLIKHFKERVRRIEELERSAVDGQVVATSGNLIPLKEGIHRLGFEPGTHDRPEKVDDLKAENYTSEFPNIDIRHDNNLTQNRWNINQFRSKPTEWIEADEIPGWGKIQL
jgi:glycosyltransferase involved in cell wall biosynthesis